MGSDVTGDLLGLRLWSSHPSASQAEQSSAPITPGTERTTPRPGDASPNAQPGDALAAALAKGAGVGAAIAGRGGQEGRQIPGWTIAVGAVAQGSAQGAPGEGGAADAGPDGNGKVGKKKGGKVNAGGGGGGNDKAESTETKHYLAAGFASGHFGPVNRFMAWGTASFMNPGGFARWGRAPSPGPSPSPILGARSQDGAQRPQVEGHPEHRGLVADQQRLLLRQEGFRQRIRFRCARCARWRRGQGRRRAAQHRGRERGPGHRQRPADARLHEAG